MRKYTILLFAVNLVAFSAQCYSQIIVKKRVIDGGFKNAHSLYVVDLDHDGREDILSGSFRSGLRWYKNSGNGNFGKRNISNFQGSRIYAKDVDVDGDIDVIAASPAVNELIWLENDGNENFSERLLEKKQTSLPGGYESVFAKDLTGDGRPEILSTDWLFNEVALWENRGKTFKKRVLDANFTNAHAIHAANFDHDGDFDIVASNAKETVIWFNNGNGGLSRRTIDKQSSVLTLWAGDIDGDGDLDITRMANQQNSEERVLDWLENSGGGGFTKHIIHKGKGISHLIPGVVNAIHGDVDGDGHTDIVSAGLEGGEVNLWKNDGNENFSKIRIDSNLKNPIGVATLDFDKDGDDDIVVAVERENSVILYEVVGSGESNPTLTILAPNGGERWTQNTNQSIRWKSAGSIDQVKLEYSLNNGNSWAVIAASTPNDGEYDWSLPAVESNTCLIRISDPTDSNPTDRSDAVFSIVEQVQGITVISPNGGERWLINSTRSIRWSSEGIIANVKLEFSSNNGNSWTEIAASTPNDGEYDWSLPAEESNDYLIRISDAADNNPADGSDAVFSIIEQGQGITLTSPNGGERWQVNSTQLILWSSEGQIANVKLEFSSNNGNSWAEITASTPDDGEFSWRTPNTTSNSCLIRISALVSGVDIADTSDNNFSLIDVVDSIIIDDDDPGYNESGAKWNKYESEGAYDGDLHYSYASSAVAEWRFELPSLGKYEVSVFFGRFRFGGLKDAIYRVFHAKGQSDYNFNQDDNSQTHRWQVLGEFEFNTSPAIVHIRVGENGPIVADAVRLRRISGGGAPPPNPTSLKLDQPNGGEQWLGGSLQEITWTSEGGIANVKLDYSLNKGQNWTDIIASTPNDGKYAWTVPETVSNTCLVRISDATENNPSDISDEVFSIVDATTTTTIIVDNLDPGYQELSGYWNRNNGQKSYDSGLRYSYASSALAEWQVRLPSLGRYEVSIYYGYFQFGGQKEAVYRVLHASGQSNFSYDQDNQSLAGNWQVLGEFEFSSSTAVVQIRRGADGPIVADAIRFKQVQNSGKTLPKTWNPPQDSIDISDDGLLSGVPTEYSLAQNYPNPFNAETQIKFGIPEPDRVVIRIYNLRGERVRTLLNSELAAGQYLVIWDGKNDKGMEVSSGVYSYLIRTKNWKSSRRMSLIK